MLALSSPAFSQFLYSALYEELIAPTHRQKCPESDLQTVHLSFPYVITFRLVTAVNPRPTSTMMDPMAGIDGNTPGVQETDEKDVIDVNSLRYNVERVDKIQSVMCIASGCVAGICGLTGLEGLGAYFGWDRV